jgi:hypothetical protein
VKKINGVWIVLFLSRGFQENHSVFKKTERFSRKTEQFSNFSNIFYFIKFCRTRYFKFLNSVLIKTLEMDSNFLEFFILKILNFHEQFVHGA